MTQNLLGTNVVTQVAIVVRDIESHNGLIVGGERVIEAELAPGVPFTVGSTTFALEHPAELGVAGAALEIRRAKLLVELIAELIEARAMEHAADAVAERAVDALERLAVVRDAYQRITEQLQLFAIPMPGEAGR